MNNIYFIIISLLCILYVASIVRKGNFSIAESFWWMIASILMLLLSIFPYSIDYIAKVFDVEYPPTLFLVFCIIFLVFINFKNSKKISEQQLKITELAQNLAIIKEKLEHEKEKKNNRHE